LESFLNRSSPDRAGSSFSVKENRNEGRQKAVAKPKGQEGTGTTAAVGKPKFGSEFSKLRAEAEYRIGVARKKSTEKRDLVTHFTAIARQFAQVNS
jgi:hypothetical protein